MFLAKRNGRLGPLGAAALLGVLMAGCQSQRDPAIVVMLIESAPINLDPRVGTDAQSARIAELIFDSPLRRDARSQLQPGVATSWENPDELTYVLHLRTDVSFHDGRPLRAQDVQYTLQSLTSGKIKSLKAGSFTRVVAVEAPDERTVIIRLKEPYASFLWNLTQGAFGIVPEGSGAEIKDLPIGSGPFRFVEASSEEYVRLRRNPDYWGGAPNLTALEFKVVPDATTRALELRNGSADIVVNALPADTVESLQQAPHLTVSQVPGNTYQYIGLNVSSQKLALPVRQAIAYGIDREALINHFWRGHVRPADSVLPGNHWAHGSNLVEYKYDPAKAVELLEEAGFQANRQGTRLSLEMKTSTDQGGRELAAILQNQLRRVGIELTPKMHEFATFYADISKGNFDLFSLRWIGGNEDPDVFEYVFHSQKVPPLGANRGRYRSQQADILIESGRSSTEINSRRKDYQQLQELLNRDLPYIHLWYLDTVAVHHSRIHGIELQGDGSYLFLTKASVSK